MNQKHHINQDLEKVETFLASELAKAELSEGGVRDVKHHMLAQIRSGNAEMLPSGLDLVAQTLKSVRDQVSLHKSRVRAMREDVLDGGADMLGKWRFQWIFNSLKYATASFMLLIFVFSMALFWPIESRVTRAAKWTFIENVRGEVYVNRGGRIESVGPNYALQQGDLIFTDESSFVVIRFMDDTVARLGSNASLKIKELYIEPDNEVNTQVRVVLEEGQAWARVLNLVDSESSFVIETDLAVAEVDDRAAFEIASFEDETTLAVFDNAVDFSQKKGALEEIQPVVSGYKAEIKKRKTDTLVAVSDYEFVVEKNDAVTSDWSIENMELDIEHEEKVLAENLESNKKTLNEQNRFVAMIADFQNSAKGLYEDPEFDQLKQNFVAAHLGFIEAQQILVAANDDRSLRTEALGYLYTYKNTVADIVEKMPELKEKDAAKADALANFVEDNLQIQRKSLDVVMPDNALYTAKKVLYDIYSEYPTNDVDKFLVQLSRSRSRLLEVEGMINRGDLRGAESQFETYLRELDQFLPLVNEENQQELFKLLALQIDQFKQLKVIEEKLMEKEDERLLLVVRGVKASSMDKLMEIVRSYDTRVLPFDLLQEFNSLVANYETEPVKKFEATVELTDMMKEYPEYEVVVEDDGLLDINEEQVIEDEVIESVIKDKESTAEVEGEMTSSRLKFD